MAKLLIGNVKGPTGAQGPTGPTGPQGPIGPSGKGIPAGGTDGQSLVKDGLDNYAARWEMRAKAVNESQVDEEGVIRLDRVPYAENLYDTSAQESVGEYIARTAGGNVSIADGDAWVTKLAGRRIHTGYTPESINMTVTPAARGEGESGIQAVLDRDTFVAYVATSGTITLTFTTAWSADPTLYGITVTGTPISGDEIVIVYVKEVRGTITHSNPTAFIETGWNLYDHSTGYARALKYSNVFGFMIGGAYTKLEFAASISGPWEEITPDDGLFDVPSDGWLKVTGGNNSTTYILMTWSDWDEGYEGTWKAYSESKINLSTIMTSRFPYGLMQVGSVHDTIELGMQKAISRVERKAYNSTNLAAAKASGRQYEYDENYIYIERETPVENVFVLSNKVTACDHGLEIVETTTVPVYIESMYGQNLKEKLTHDLPNAIAANSDAIAKLQEVTFANKYACNGFYRGKNLGTITSANIAQFVTDHGLATGNYVDIYPGDYFTIQDGTYNVEWMVAGVGIQHNKGDTANAHGIECIPRAQGFAYGTQMNSSNTTAGGYKGSAMYTFLKDTVAPKLSAVLGSHLLDQHVLLSNAVDAAKSAPCAILGTGQASGWEWDSVKCVLMSEPQVYGHSVFGGAYDVGEANQILPVFNFISPVEFGRGGFWLRAVASSALFAYCGGSGCSDCAGASAAWRCVRPLIRIG